MTEEQQTNGEEYSVEELSEHNNFLLNGVIDLLIKKGLITEAELNKTLEEMYDEECGCGCGCDCAEEKEGEATTKIEDEFSEEE